MCGITLYLSKQKDYENAVEQVLASLYELQNRGYDSFGISYFNRKTNNYHVYKKSCKQTGVQDNDLFNIFTENTVGMTSNICVGHSRWATHGAITDNNAHPHTSFGEMFICVHNGIIENYREIKTRLELFNIHFSSETDTEVIVNLMEYNYKNLFSNNKNNDSIEVLVEQAINITINELQGTYGLIIMCNNTPDNVYIIKNGSPLLIAEDDNCIMATSELCGFNKNINNYMEIENDQLIVLSCINGIKYTSQNKLEIKEISEDFKLNYLTQTLGIYNHYTQKEIYEQERTLMLSLNNGGRIANNSIKLGGLDSLKPHLLSIKHIVFIGCGTSYYAGCIGVEYMKQMSQLSINNNDINFWCFDGSEFEEKDIPKGGRCLFVFISQSGETMDLIRHITWLRDTTHLMMGIINVVESTIAKEVLCGIYMNVGREVAVASTKSFNSSLLLLKLLSLWFLQERQDKTNIEQSIIEKYILDIKAVVNNVKFLNHTMELMLDELNYDVFDCEHVFVLGRGTTEYIAKECALKLKEICYVHGEGYSGSSLKHGPLALIHTGFPIIMMINMDNYQKMMNIFKEVNARGAYVLVLSTLSQALNKQLGIINNQETNNNIKLIQLPQLGSCSEIIFMITLQHICYNLSIYRGINPDKPKNLAKVVTVE